MELHFKQGESDEPSLVDLHEKEHIHMATFRSFCECSYPTQAEYAIISPKIMQLGGWYARNPDI